MTRSDDTFAHDLCHWAIKDLESESDQNKKQKEASENRAKDLDIFLKELEAEKKQQESKAEAAAQKHQETLTRIETLQSDLNNQSLDFEYERRAINERYISQLTQLKIKVSALNGKLGKIARLETEVEILRTKIKFLESKTPEKDIKKIKLKYIQDLEKTSLQPSAISEIKKLIESPGTHKTVSINCFPWSENIRVPLLMGLRLNPQLSTIKLLNARFTKDEFKGFLGRDIINLHLRTSYITDEFLHFMSSFSKINSLVLDNNYLTLEGLKSLLCLPNLSVLNVNGNNVGDDGARYLANLKTLKTLNLEGNNVGKNAQTFLQKKLPKCSITF